MVFEPYLVFYAIEMDSIRIHRIIHEKRSFIGLL